MRRTVLILLVALAVVGGAFFLVPAGLRDAPRGGPSDGPPEIPPTAPPLTGPGGPDDPTGWVWVRVRPGSPDGGTSPALPHAPAPADPEAELRDRVRDALLAPEVAP